MPTPLSTPQESYDQADRYASLHPNYNNWKYGEMTPPDGPWYTQIIPQSTARIKRIFPESIKQIERMVQIPQQWFQKPETPKERKETWRYGPMTPPEKWYDWVPESIRRPPSIWSELETNELEEREAKRRRLFDEYGDVDFGHCAQAKGWTEQGACMCTITWRLPGRFPRSFCETVYNGVVGRTRMELPPMEEPIEEESPHKPCWEVKPIPEEPETRLCWAKQYNSRLERYEYVSKQWRPPSEGVEEGEVEEESFRESLERDGTEYRYKPQFVSPERPEPDDIPYPSQLPEDLEDPFPCGRKPPWLQNVHKFVRAEELASPPAPASQFVNKSGVLLGKFSEGYFRVPYYDPDYRRFRYAEPSTMDMNNLRFQFSSDAPPPKPVPPRRPKPLPKRPLVMAQRNPELVPMQKPEYEPMPVYEPPSIRVPLRPKSKPTSKPPVENIYHRPRSVMFPPNSRDTQDDTPCPPPRKLKPKAVQRKRKVRFKDDDGEYRPSESEESEEEAIETPSHSTVPVEPSRKIGKRRRKRRNSDPTYRQHGMRENNRIEKKDLQQMYREEVGDDDNVKSKETPALQPTKPKPGLKPKSILKNGKGKEPEPVASKSRWNDTAAFPSKPSKLQESTWGSPQNSNDPPRPNRTARKQKGSKDGDYIPFRDREEERRERLDVRDMKKQVDQQAEREPEPELEPEHSESEDPLKMVKPQKKTPRRRKAPEDRAYRPGRRI
ncbi:hypothetical protein TWF281_002025 [Arthrobotrys megalospora]